MHSCIYNTFVRQCIPEMHTTGRMHICKEALYLTFASKWKQALGSLSAACSRRPTSLTLPTPLANQICLIKGQAFNGRLWRCVYKATLGPANNNASRRWHGAQAHSCAFCPRLIFYNNKIQISSDISLSYSLYFWRILNTQRSGRWNYACFLPVTQSPQSGQHEKSSGLR